MSFSEDLSWMHDFFFTSLRIGGVLIEWSRVISLLYKTQIFLILVCRSYRMQQTARVSSRRVLSSVATLLGKASCPCNVPRQSFTTYSLQELQKPQKHSLPGDLVTWGSLGFCRTSRFAAGFTPLQHKPLNSIMDLERTKDRPVEDLIAIWDDVISHNVACNSHSVDPFKLCCTCGLVGLVLYSACVA